MLRFDHWWGAWLAATTGIPRRIGYDRAKRRPFLTDTLPYQSERHEVERNVALVAALAPNAAEQTGPLRFAISKRRARGQPIGCGPAALEEDVAR